MNDTMECEGLVQSYLVFGCIPRFFSTKSTLPTQQQIMRAMQSAWREMAIITAELRIRKALSSRVPRNADLVIEAGDLIRVFHETHKRYVGPYPVIRVDGTHMFIIDNYSEVKFNKHQVLPASTYGNIISGKHLVTALHSSPPKLSSNLPCPQRDRKRPHHGGSSSQWSSNANWATWSGTKTRNRKLGTTWHMGTRSPRRCTAEIKYYLCIFRDCYQRCGNRKAYLQGTIYRPWSSWCVKTQSRSRFNQCPPNFCKTTDRNCCYYWIRRPDRRYFSSVPPISK